MICKSIIFWKCIQYTIHWDKTQIFKKSPSKKKRCKKCPFFFLSRVPTYHSFTFNLRFLYDPKHKVCLPKTMCRIFHFRIRFVFIKDIHREKAPLNETTTKITNMDIWVVGTSNWLFLRGSKTGTNFPKKSRYWQNFTLCDRSIL